MASLIDNLELVGKVKSIFQYPVKSCGGISLTEANCLATGIDANGVHDRQLFVMKNNIMLVGSVTGGALVKVQTRVEQNQLILSIKGKHDCSVPLDKITLGTVQPVAFMGRSVNCIDCGEDVGKWLDDALGEPLGTMRLLYHPELEDHRKNSEGAAPWNKNATKDDQIFLQHTSAIHLVNEESVDDLNVRLSEKYDEPPYVDVLQFRPNIVVEGSTAYAEDYWDEVIIGSALHMGAQKHVNRCNLATIDIRSGKPMVKGEPLKTLQTYRPRTVDFIIPGLGQYKGDSVLGMDMIVKTPGAIKVGDPVYALINEDLYAKLGGIVGISD